MKPKDFKNLPKILTLLPVQGAVLFPRGQLPIPILTPKHFSVVADVWHTHKIIGLVQLNSDEITDDANPSIFKAGSAGKITEISELEDGRLYATVTGICRFNILRELTTQDEMLRAEVDYEPFEGDFIHDGDFTLDRTKLMLELGKYFKRLDIDANWEEIHRIPNEKLITALAMACPFTSSERQALLQCTSMKDQSRMIISFIEMANMEPNLYKITCH